MKNLLILTILVFLSLDVTAQVAINTDDSDPHASAMLDVKSIDKGMLVPRMTTAQRMAIASPATGLLVFDTDNAGFWFYNGTVWSNLDASDPSNHIADTDNDTKIHVEKNNDEDMIRFDVASAEAMTISSSGKVGIGTSSPSAKLDVEGNVKIADGTQSNGYVLKSDTLGNASWQPLVDIDSTDLVSPELQASLSIGGGGGFFSNQLQSVAVQGNYAYVSSTGGHLKVIDISNPNGPNLAGSLASGESYLSLTAQGNYIYAAGIGLRVIDISDPANPGLAGSIATGGISWSVAVQGNYAYMVDVESNDLKVIDISNPASPSLTGSLAIDDLPISVAVQGNYAYVVDVVSNDLKVIDISNPASPGLTGSLAIDDSPRSVKVKGNYVYVVDQTSDDLKVIDVSNPASPSVIKSLSIGPNTSSLAVQGNLAYVIDFDSNDLKVIDLSNPVSPVVIGSLNVGNSPKSIAIQDDYAYVVDAAGGNLKVISIFGTKALLSVNADGTISYSTNVLDLNLSDNTLSLNGISTVDLSPYLDNTDVQTLTLNNTDLSISGGNSVNLSSLVNDDNWMVNGPNIYTDIATDVGLGTSIPNSALSIGNLSADGAGSASDGITFHNQNAGGFGHAAIYANGSSGYNGSLIFATDGDGAKNHNYTEKMRISPDGKVGIGTTNPGSTLDINGQITMRTGANMGYIPVSDDTGTMTWTNPASIPVGAQNLNFTGTTLSISGGNSVNLSNLVNDNDWTVNGSKIYTDISKDIGIGTSNPNSALSIGNLSADNAGSASDGITFHNQNAGGFGHAAIYANGSSGYNGSLIFATDGDGSRNHNYTERMRITHNGRVGIGISNPSHPLQMGSGAHVTAGGVWTNASDRAKKDNIRKMAYGLEEILQMKPVAYTYKADDSESIGFIAQDLEVLIPEVVSGVEGEKGVAYGLLTSVLVNAIKEQQEEIQELKAKNIILEAKTEKIETVESELAELKAMMQQMQSEGLTVQNK